MTIRRVRRLLRLHVGALVDRLDEVAAHPWQPVARTQLRSEELTHARVREAVQAGAAFLRRHQRSDGRWRGFLLPPGSASTWLTAHVAFVVERVADLDDACWRAAHFLAKVGADDGGWGYNRRVAVDCDSSAQALLVLDRFGIRAEEFLVEALAESQLPCGGFPTYPSEDPASPPATGWHAAHADVSVLVAEALRRRGGFDERVQRCATWVEQQLTSGVLPSYWWPGPYYGLWVQAKVDRLPRASAAITRTALQSSARQPQMGMALSAAIRAGLSDEQITPFVGALLQGQCADGSWACAPCLRVSSPREFVATEHVSGPVFADRRRILSTAHAVAALTSALPAS